MNNTKKELIRRLVNGAGKTGPEMTHNISMLGEGSMTNGLVALYRSGQVNGVIIGAGVVIALVATYKTGKAVMEGIQTKRTIRQTCQEQMTPTAAKATAVSGNTDARSDGEMVDRPAGNADDCDTAPESIDD